MRAKARMGGIYSFSSGGAVYRISRRIGRGGMGEVYLGLQEGMGGLERLVVIKRIYPHFGEDEQFTRMLLEEARLAASIRHPNVVQIHDIGRDADGYFIAMEYLSGETLVYITRTLRARGETVPPAVACRIGVEVAAGLDCAHTATDPAGHPQPIVHRDVTPSNLIVCFNGLVKIVDFGVAKATLHEGHTRGGVKGKMSYLAPEQLYDKPIDGRTDVFQLGICLHEFLTGSRLFKGENDQQRAVAVLEQAIPRPSELVPSLPAQLDEVILWALERDPDRRPASADAFCRALESAAASIGGAMSGHDLAGWMKTTFADRLAERRHFERQCVAEMREGRTSAERAASSGAFHIASMSAADSMSRDDLGQAPPRTALTGGGSLSPPSSADSDSLLAYQHQQYAPQSGSSLSPPTAARRSMLRWVLAGSIGTAILVAVVAVAWRLGSSSASRAAAARTPVAAPPAAPVQPDPKPPPPAPAPRRMFEVAVTVAPPEAVIELDGVAVGKGSFHTTLPVDGTRHVMTVRADGYEAVGVDFSDQPPPARVELDPLRPSPAPPTARRSSGDRAVRRAPPPPAAKRPPKARPRSSDGDEPAMTDNPDPWADEGQGEGVKTPEKP